MDKSAFIQAELLSLVLLLASFNPVFESNSVSSTIETDEARLASRYGGRVEYIFAQEGETLTNEQVTALLAELEAGPRSQEIAAAA